MDYYHRLVNYVGDYMFKKQPQDDIVEMTSSLDGYLNFVCRVVNWDDPKLSWLTFIFLNAVYMLILYYEVRFYCCAFTFAAFLLFLDYYAESIDFKHQKRYTSIQQVSAILRNIFAHVHALKRDNPSMFCGVMVSLFLTLSFIGRTLPGKALGYIILLVIFFGPVLINLIPKEYKDKVNQFLACVRNSEGIVAENELIPFISNKDFSAERDADLDSLLTDKTQDSITNSLISGIASMPSYMDADIVDDIEEDDLLPKMTTRQRAAVDYSSDSDSEHRNMAFDSAHFNKDSSSDDEQYTQGLNFADSTDSMPLPSSIPNLSQQIDLVGNITAMGSSILNVLKSTSQSAPEATKTTKTSKKTTRQDSDSDFEFINTEDAEDT